ncbi:MAG: PAS domain S-box protein [Bacteroidales bacterium]|nr:PAS domain-containing protein [Bacteroidales bacterium]
MSRKTSHILLLIIISLAILIVGFINSYQNYIYQLKEGQQQLVERVNIIKSSLNHSDIQSLSCDISDTNKTEYQTLNLKLSSINDAFPDLRYIYIIKEIDSVLYFLIDTEPLNRSFPNPPKLAMPGEIYDDAPREFYASFYQQREIIYGPYVDKWGKFIAVLSPIYNPSNNEIIGALGIDVVYNNFISPYTARTINPIIISVFVVIMLIIFYLIYTYIILNEKKENKSLEFLKNTIENWDSPFVILDTNHKIIDFNISAMFVFNSLFNAELVEGENITQFFHNELKLEVDNKLQLLSQSAKNKSIVQYHIGSISNPNQILFVFSSIKNKSNEISHYVLYILEDKNLILADKSISFLKEIEKTMANIEDFILSCKYDGTIESATKSIEITLEYDELDLINKSLKDIVSISSWEQINQGITILKNKNHNSNFTLDIHYKKSNGDFSEYNSQIIRREGKIGEKAGFLIVSRKIDKKSPDLKQSAFKNIDLSNIPAIVYICDIDRDWTMRYMSPETYQITKYLPEEVVNNKKITFNELILPQYRDIIWSKWKDVIENNAIFEEEYQIKTKDGKIKWVYEKANSIYDSNNTPIAIKGVIIDINDRKKHEEISKINEERFKKFLDSPISIISINNELNIIDFNGKFANFVSENSDKIIGKNLIDFISFEHRTESSKHLYGLKENHKQIFNTYFKIDDSEKFVVLYCSKINDLESVCFIIDQSDVYSQINSLKTEKFEFEKLIQNSDVPIFITETSNGEILFQNKMAQKLKRLKLFNNEEISIDNIENILLEIINKSEISENLILENLDNNDNLINTYRIIVSKFFENKNSSKTMISLINISTEIELKNRLQKGEKTINNLISYTLNNTYRQTLLNSPENNTVDLYSKLFTGTYEKELKYIGLNEIINGVISRHLKYDYKVFYQYEKEENYEFLLDTQLSKELICVLAHFVNRFGNGYVVCKVQHFSDKLVFNYSSVIDKDVIDIFSKHINSNFLDSQNNNESDESKIFDIIFLNKLVKIAASHIEFNVLEGNIAQFSLSFKTKVKELEAPKQFYDLSKLYDSASIIYTNNLIGKELTKSISNYIPKTHFFNDYLELIRDLNGSVDDFSQIIISENMPNGVSIWDIATKIESLLISKDVKLLVLSPFGELRYVEDLFKNAKFKYEILAIPFTLEQLKLSLIRL